MKFMAKAKSTYLIIRNNTRLNIPSNYNHRFLMSSHSCIAGVELFNITSLGRLTIRK